MDKYEFKKDIFGDKRYYLNGLLHKEDGPAVEWSTGIKVWYKNGKLHREDGPAVEYINGDKFWWLNGKFYGNYCNFTNESWIKFVKTLIFY